MLRFRSLWTQRKVATVRRLHHSSPPRGQRDELPSRRCDRLDGPEGASLRGLNISGTLVAAPPVLCSLVPSLYAGAEVGGQNTVLRSPSPWTGREMAIARGRGCYGSAIQARYVVSRTNSNNTDGSGKRFSPAHPQAALSWSPPTLLARCPYNFALSRLKTDN
jgi:hypothetical protein